MDTTVDYANSLEARSSSEETYHKELPTWQGTVNSSGEMRSEPSLTQTRWRQHQESCRRGPKFYLDGSQPNMTSATPFLNWWNPRQKLCPMPYFKVEKNRSGLESYLLILGPSSGEKVVRSNDEG